jgi:hypothetical protein
MTRFEEDDSLAKIWRGIGADAPDAVLDARILAAARAQRRRRLLAPIGALLAACLVLAIFVSWPQPTPLPKPGLPSAHEAGVTAIVADPEAMHQMMIRQMPGGSAYSEIVHK